LILKDKLTLEKQITFIYFLVASAEIIAELYENKLSVFILKPLFSIILMLLYWNTSNQKSNIFFIAVFFSMITNLFFISKSEEVLFIGLILFLIYRILVIYYIFKLTKIKDFVPLTIAIILFLFVFFYLLSICSGLSTNSYNILIVQNILIAVIGAMALSRYVMNDVHKYPWLLMFGLLSVTQYFIVFVEKYYLSDLAPPSLRPLAMVLNIGVYYTFYKFVIEIEQSITISEPKN
jgi:YhhN family